MKENTFRSAHLGSAAAAYTAARTAAELGCEPVYQQKLLKMAADHGHARAALEVAYLLLHGAFLYFNPDGPPRPVGDAAQARAYLRTASQSGDPRGVYLYAKCLGRGVGGEQDLTAQNALLKSLSPDYLQKEIPRLVALECAYFGLPGNTPQSACKNRKVA